MNATAHFSCHDLYLLNASLILHTALENKIDSISALKSQQGED